MKKSEQKILSIEIFLLIILIFNIFIMKILNDYTLPLLLGLFFVLLYIFLGFEKDNKRDFKNDLINILIFIFSYYILIYVFGIFMGFLLSGYSLKFKSIILNIFPIVLFQLAKEILRYQINIKGERQNIILILSCTIFILADICSILYLYDLSDISDFIKMVELYLIPFISENILMTYLSVKSGYKITIIYQLLMKLTVYFVPIIPDLGDYIDILIRLIFPSIVLYMMVNETRRLKIKNFIISKQNNKFSKVFFTLTLLLLIVVVYLTSGVFRYSAVTIGSGSMSPNLNVGDITIVQKTRDYSHLKIGDILVYEKQNKIIIHRITRIIKHDDTYVFKTKGDANNEEDNYDIWQQEIIGTVKLNIKFLGYPTIWLNELTK